MILEDRFIYAIIEHNAINDAFAFGFKKDFIISEKQKEVFEWVYAQAIDYGSCPSHDRLKMHFPDYMVTKSKDTLTSLIEDLKARYIFEKQKEFIQKKGQLLKVSTRDFKSLKAAVNEMSLEMKQFVLDLEDNVQNSSILEVNSKSVENYINNLKERRDTEEILGYVTPWDSINKQIGGWHPSDLIVIVARTGKGKTWELVACIDAIIKNEKKPTTILVESNEIKVESMLDRSAASISKVSYSAIKNGALNDYQMDAVKTALLDIESSGHKLIISGNDADMGGSGIASVESRIIKHKPDIVFIDGAYLMDDDMGGRDKYIKAGNIARGLKKLGKRRNIPIVITWQLNRKGASDTADTENIGLSDDLGQDASVVLALFQTEDMKERQQMLIRIIKSRESGKFEINAKWDFENMDFSEYPEELFLDDESDILETTSSDSINYRDESLF